MTVEKSLEKGGLTLVVMAEVATSDVDVATFKFSGRKIKSMDLLSKSDPYFILTRMSLSKEATSVYRSEFIKNTENPSWPTFAVSVRQLCNGDYNRPLTMYVFDKDPKHDDFIGSFTTTLQELKHARESEKSKGFVISDMKSKVTGTIMVEELVIRPMPTFVDRHDN